MHDTQDQIEHHQRGEVIFPRIGESGKCGCPEKVVSQKDFSVTFGSLDFDEVYFPMVSRNDDQAIFGLPPKGLKPGRARTWVNHVIKPMARPSPKETPIKASVVPKEDSIVPDLGDLYGFSDDDEIPVNTMPAYYPPPRSSIRNWSSGGGLSSRLSHRTVTPLANDPSFPVYRSSSNVAPEAEPLPVSITLQY